jgi:hypothetical protein
MISFGSGYISGHPFFRETDFFNSHVFYHVGDKHALPAFIHDVLEDTDVTAEECAACSAIPSRTGVGS